MPRYICAHLSQEKIIIMSEGLNFDMSFTEVDASSSQIGSAWCIACVACAMCGLSPTLAAAAACASVG